MHEQALGHGAPGLSCPKDEHEDASAERLPLFDLSLQPSMHTLLMLHGRPVVSVRRRMTVRSGIVDQRSTLSWNTFLFL